MVLSSLQLTAFEAVSSAGSISRAAEDLNISQSALSQRILNLEAELGASLFVRQKKGVTLTESGQKLLGYCRSQSSLENEFLSEFKGDEKVSSGPLRICGLSTVVRSTLLPRLQKFIASHPHLLLEVSNAELSDVEAKLKSSEVDYILTYSHIQMGGVARVPFMVEKNVLVEGIDCDQKDVFLDHDSKDITTEQFFMQQPESKRPKKIKRRFFDEIYSIIDAVEMGFGRAVVPQHLLPGRKLKVVKGYKSLNFNVDLCFLRQPFYSQLHQRFIDEIKSYPKGDS